MDGEVVEVPLNLLATMRNCVNGSNSDEGVSSDNQCTRELPSDGRNL